MPSNDDIEIEDQPYAADASPSALSLGYIAESNSEEDPKEDSEEDPIDYATDTDDDEEDKEEEEESSYDNEEEEKHLAPAVALSAVDPVPSDEETKLFETDESVATPPPPPKPAYHTTSSMSVRTQAHIPYSFEEEVARLFALPTPPPSPLTPLSSLLPQIPSPPTHHPLPLPAQSTSRRADMPEAKLPPRKSRDLLWLVESIIVFLDTLDTIIRGSERKAMAAVESVNLRVNYQASVNRWESEEFQTRHQDAQDDHERVEARQALDRFEAYTRALETWITVLETQAYRHEWQRQDANDHATGRIMRIQALEARARVDTLEDTSSSA
ncbi:hypothetical protein Tco_0400311 [Tanacetum coccineum]